MARSVLGPEIEQLVDLLAKLPGLGPRSARRAALHLIKRKEALLNPLVSALAQAGEKISTCSICGNLDTSDPCSICTNAARDETSLCVVADVADLWALERANAFRGKYHVLGGVLSALDGVTPEDLRINSLLSRVQETGVKEVIIALGATVDGQTTAHYLTDQLVPLGADVTQLAQGVPVGGELDYLDDGTLMAALKDRRAL